VQVKNKRERSIPVGLQVWSRQVGLVRGTLWPTGSSAGRMVARTTSEVVDSFLVESQNQGRAGMTWGASHEWRLGGGHTKSAGFQWFTTKPLGSFVDPQNQDRRLKRARLQH
jgi:hypothetical protein